MKPLTKRAILTPRPQSDETMIEVRGQDGRLYGRYDPARQLLEVRKGSQIEVIDLKILPRP